jgi:hypothetical protein
MSDAPKPDAPKPDASQPDAPKPDAPKPSRPHLWRQSTDTPAGGPPADGAPGKRKKAYVVFGLLLALVGAIAAWLFYLSPVPLPAFFGAWIDQYEDPDIPANAWAAEDRTALEGLHWRRINVFTSQKLRLLRQVLGDLRKQGDAPVVLFLSAYAVARPNGDVYLLPADASVQEEPTWLPLPDVLRYLGACPSRHKLLILDLMRPFAEPRLGLLGDDVATPTQALLEAATRADPHLYVLWACGPGQHSQISEALGHSAFAFYLQQGLLGAADGYATGSRDGRVSFRELARFVQARVDRWSALTGRPRQTPGFLGKGADFPLVAIADDRPAAPQRPVPTDPKWLLDAWQTRDVWWKEATARVPPGLLRELEDALLRAERQLEAGAEAGRVQEGVERLLGRLSAQRQRWRDARLPERPPSLARAVARGQPEPDPAAGAVRTKYHDLLDMAAKVQAAAKPDKEDTKRLEAERAAFLKQFAGKPFDLAWLVFDELGKELLPQPEVVRFAAKLLADGPKGPAYEETAFIKSLAAWKVKDWPAPAVRRALRLVKEAAQAEARADDARLLPWVKQRLEAARAARKAALGDRGLFAEPGTAAAKAAGDALDDATREFQILNGDLRDLAEAFREYEDALVLLPGYVAYLDGSPADRPLWEQAITEALELQAKLQAGPPKGAQAPAAEIRNLRKLTESLREVVKERLYAPAKGRALALIAKSDKAEAVDWLPMKALLRLPWPEAGVRATLWIALRKLSGRLTAKVLEEDAQDDEARRQTPAPPAVDSAGLAERDKQHALERVRVSLGLLRLHGVANLKALTDALAEAESGAAGAWPVLIDQLRQAWATVRARAPDDQAGNMP